MRERSVGRGRRGGHSEGLNGGLLRIESQEEARLNARHRRVPIEQHVQAPALSIPTLHRARNPVVPLKDAQSLHRVNLWRGAVTSHEQLEQDIVLVRVAVHHEDDRHGYGVVPCLSAEADRLRGLIVSQNP
eukprot:scaffold34557_cov66-Phaeocystis_antarctica.AAC.2